MNINFDFSYKKKEPLFVNFEMNITDNDVTVLCGHNGVGKTTLLKVIAGILPSNFEHPSGWYVPAHGGLMKHFSLEDHLKIMNIKKTPFWTEAFEKLGAPSFYKKPVRNLSSGQTAIAAILTAFASDQSVLLLDEPFSALDPINAEILSNILNQSNKTILLTSHDLFLTAETTNNIQFMKNARISWINTLDKINVDQLKSEYKQFA